MPDKYEWRKEEKSIYPSGKKPSIVTLPTQTFITISGQGNPNTEAFGEHIAALYAMSYTIKMAPKKDIHFPGAFDYTVYPLEGFWTLPDGYNKAEVDKDQLIYKIMLKQPDFVTQAVFDQAFEMAKSKIPVDLQSELRLETIDESEVGMILHVGSFDNEPESFAKLAEFLAAEGYERTSKAHKEIYLSDFRRVAEEKRKTILRVTIKKQA